jgi:putative DNA primase/helicase
MTSVPTPHQAPTPTPPPPAARPARATTSALATAPAEFRLTDIGNAERLIHQFGRDIRYVPVWKSWLVWDSRRWLEDETKQIERFAKACVRSMLADLRSPLFPAEHKDALRAHAYKSESNKSINAMIARASAEEGVAIAHTELDRDPWVLTVENGELDLHTAQLRDHRRESLSTKYVPIRWDPEARCDRWEQFLRRVLGGNQELISFVQRAVGYSLTGLTVEQCLFFLYGSGQNGKSTFLEIMRAVSGEYAMQADFTTFLERRGDQGPRDDIARLLGARVVTSSEVGENKRLNESLVKALTGGDTVAARRLYSKAFEFEPAFKLWLAANHKPMISGTDLGIWRRIRLIPFTVEIPAEERDETLKDALKAELPGILAWAVAGCRLWQQHGLGLPDAVREATAAYRVEQDILGAFLDEYCEVGPGYSAPTPALYDAYREWARDGELTPVSKIKFGRQLEERGFHGEKQGTGNNRVIWRQGLRLVRWANSTPMRDLAVREQEELEV